MWRVTRALTCFCDVGHNSWLTHSIAAKQKTVFHFSKWKSCMMCIVSENVEIQLWLVWVCQSNICNTSFTPSNTRKSTEFCWSKLQCVMSVKLDCSVKCFKRYKHVCQCLYTISKGIVECRMFCRRGVQHFCMWRFCMWRVFGGYFLEVQTFEQCVQL